MSVRSLMKAEKARRAALKSKTSGVPEEANEHVYASVQAENADEEQDDIVEAKDKQTANVPVDFFDSVSPQIRVKPKRDFREFVEEIEETEEKITYEYDSDFVVEETVPPLQTLLKGCGNEIDDTGNSDGISAGTALGTTNRLDLSVTEAARLLKSCNDDELVNDIFDTAVYGELDTAFHSELQHEVEEKEKKNLREISERSRPTEELMMNGQIPIEFFDHEIRTLRSEKNHQTDQSNGGMYVQDTDERLSELTRSAVELKQMTDSFDEVMTEQRRYNQNIKDIFSEAKKRRSAKFIGKSGESAESHAEVTDESLLGDFDWKAKRVRHVNSASNSTAT